MLNQLNIEEVTVGHPVAPAEVKLAEVQEKKKQTKKQHNEVLQALVKTHHW
jgi:hypothetical protein